MFVSKISTKQLFDHYFADWDATREKKNRPQVDRPEVYAYEAKIGKQLIDMDVDELFEMVTTFTNNSSANTNGYFINYNSFNQIASEYRKIFNFYIDHYEVIKNPWYDKRMRGVAATERLAQDKPPFTWADVQEAIDKVNDEYDKDRANYLECIILLYYNGFAHAEEIVNLEESMINKETKTIELDEGRVIHLSDRCFELLEVVHNMTSMTGWRGDYAMAAWRDKYFKYNIRPSQIDTFDERPEGEIANMINRSLHTCVKTKFNLNINYRLIYMLGFYNSLIEEYGEDRARELVVSVRNSDDTQDLMNHAAYYGIEIDNPSQLKRSLRPFIGAKREA